MSSTSFPLVLGDRRGFPPSGAPLDAVRVAWEWLCARPHPVTIDGSDVVGLPDRPVPLDELRARLLSRSCPAATRDAVWAHLVRRSRTDGGTWTVAAAGMALPVLVRVARILTARFANDPSDIHAAVIAGFLHGLTRVDPDRPAVLVSLRWAAYRGGLAAVRDALRAPVPVGQRSYESTPPNPPAGHPDLVLARAVADEVITADEARLIGSTRLEHVRLADAAAARGQTYTATNTARYRAERRLLAYLAASDVTLDATRPDAATPTGTAGPSAAGPSGTRQAPPARRRRPRNAARRRTRSVTATAANPSSLASGPASAAAVVAGGDDSRGRARDVGDGASPGSHPTPPGSRQPSDQAAARQPRTGPSRRPRRPHAAPESSTRPLLRSSDALSEHACDTGVLPRPRAQATDPTAAPNTAPAAPMQAPASRVPADPNQQIRSTAAGGTGRRARPGAIGRGPRRATRPTTSPPSSTPTAPTTGQRPDAEPS